MRCKLALAALSLGLAAASSTAAQTATGTTAPAPAAAPSAASPPAAAAPSASRPAATVDRADPRQGIVRLERAGQPLGLGLVLSGDGRIVTALSAVGHGNDMSVRFSDGATLPATVVATDRKWDLALLGTGGAHWAPGLRPSPAEATPGASPLRRFRWRGGRLEETPLTVSARRSLIGRDGAVLDDMLLFQGGLTESELGSPLLDAEGEVVAVAVQACSPDSTASCRMTTVGASVAVLKSFLKRAPAREPLPAAQLGFRGATAHDGPVAGVQVLSVEPGSPAAAAGLRAAGSRGAAASADGTNGDLIVAVDDAPVTTPDELTDAINRAALVTPRAAPANAPSASDGSERSVRLLVFGSGRFREVKLPLRPPPRVQKPTPAPKPAPAPNAAASAPAAPAPPGAKPPDTPPPAPSPKPPAAPSAP